MTHPGAMIAEWLSESGRSQTWLAQRVGISPKHLNRLVFGFSLYSAHTALALARVTGIDARIWMQWKTDYELSQAATPSDGEADT